MDMKVATLSNRGEDARFSLSGDCPHCKHASVFVMRGGPHYEDIRVSDTDGNYKDPIRRYASVMQCQGCSRFILAVVTRKPHPASPGQPSNEPFEYEAHYPLGQPDDSIGDGIPEQIGGRFREALRCRWVNAFQATVLMCRRSLQVSCDKEFREMEAQGQQCPKGLIEKIDLLAEKQRITEALKKMAHRIRLLGNKGAHGDYSDIDDTITAKDADDAIKFMRHYLDHVYVLPAQLDGPVTAPQP